MRIRFCLIAGSAMLLAACAGTTVPVAMITENGHVFRGASKSSSLRDFQVSDGRMTCSGSFPWASQEKVPQTVAITCSDGRTGIAIVNRETVYDGGGTLRLSDGMEGTFVFGDQAAKV